MLTDSQTTVSKLWILSKKILSVGSTWLMASSPLWAQTQPPILQSSSDSIVAMALPPPEQSIRSLSPEQIEQERVREILLRQGPVYVDKVMDPSTLEPPSSDEDKPPTSLGLRSSMAETRLGYAQQAQSGAPSQTQAELGIRTEYRLETLNYGEFLLQLDARAQRSANGLSLAQYELADHLLGARFTARNIEFPITTDLYADTSLGDQNSQNTLALTRHYRLSLGSSQIRGLGLHLYSLRHDVVAGVGTLGKLSGGPYPGFESTHGQIQWLGYTYRLTPDWFIGGQLSQVTDGIERVAASQTIGTQNYWVSNRSAAVALGYGTDLIDDGNKRFRLSWVSSQTQNTGLPSEPSQSGIFLEGGIRWGNARHEWGLYRADPALYFGQKALGQMGQGAYYRLDHSAKTLSWGLGLEGIRQEPNSLDGQSFQQRTQHIGLHANALWRIDRNTHLGLSGTLSQFKNESEGLSSSIRQNSRYLNLYLETPFADVGRSRLNFMVRQNQSLADNAPRATGQEIQWQHDWITERYETMRPELSTTLGWARDQSQTEVRQYPTAGVTFRYWPDAFWQINGQLQYSSPRGNLSVTQGLSGSLSSELELPGQWRMGATLSLNQAVTRVNPGQLSTQTFRTSNRSFMMYLRWEGSKGTPYATAGLRNTNSPGGGAIKGVVFQDENRDGIQQTHEASLAGVEVLLDKRYRTTTDANGRFEFPLVGTGHHRISLNPDTIPLPWGRPFDESLTIDVPLRGTAEPMIGTIRIGS